MGVQIFGTTWHDLFMLNRNMYVANEFVIAFSFLKCPHAVIDSFAEMTQMRVSKRVTLCALRTRIKP